VLCVSLACEGAIATVSTPEEFGRLIASEIARWGTVIKTAGMKPD
jgi:tripartite-type tricarboxylate transporter receptor subunit TctC